MAGDPQVLKKVNGTFCFRVTGGPGGARAAWFVNAKEIGEGPKGGSGGTVLAAEPSDHPADCTITIGDADLVIAGTESSDGYTGTVPEQMAEVLGLPSVTFAKTIAVEDGTLKVDRQTEAGYDEVTCSLPAVVSVTAGVVEPRYPSFKGIMAAKSKPVENTTAADLGVEVVSWGQQISAVEDAPAREAGEVIEDDGESFNRIVEFLDELKVI